MGKVCTLYFCCCTVLPASHALLLLLRCATSSTLLCAKLIFPVVQRPLLQKKTKPAEQITNFFDTRKLARPSSAVRLACLERLLQVLLSVKVKHQE